MQFSPTNKQEQKQKKKMVTPKSPHKSDKKRGPRRKTKSGEIENKKRRH